MGGCEETFQHGERGSTETLPLERGVVVGGGGDSPFTGWTEPILGPGFFL